MDVFIHSFNDASVQSSLIQLMSVLYMPCSKLVARHSMENTEEMVSRRGFHFNRVQRTSSALASGVSVTAKCLWVFMSHIKLEALAALCSSEPGPCLALHEEQSPSSATVSTLQMSTTQEGLGKGWVWLSEALSRWAPATGVSSQREAEL